MQAQAVARQRLDQRVGDERGGIGVGVRVGGFALSCGDGGRGEGERGGAREAGARQQGETGEEAPLAREQHVPGAVEGGGERALWVGAEGGGVDAIAGQIGGEGGERALLRAGIGGELFEGERQRADGGGEGGDVRQVAGGGAAGVGLGEALSEKVHGVGIGQRRQLDGAQAVGGDGLARGQQQGDPAGSGKRVEGGVGVQRRLDVVEGEQGARAGGEGGCEGGAAGVGVGQGGDLCRPRARATRDQSSARPSAPCRDSQEVPGGAAGEGGAVGGEAGDGFGGEGGLADAAHAVQREDADGGVVITQVAHEGGRVSSRPSRVAGRGRPPGAATVAGMGGAAAVSLRSMARTAQRSSPCSTPCGPLDMSIVRDLLLGGDAGAGGANAWAAPAAILRCWRSSSACAASAASRTRRIWSRMTNMAAARSISRTKTAAPIWMASGWPRTRA